MDETALFYRLPPNKTLATKNEKLQGIKQSKDLLSVAAIVSASGEEFINSIVIDHHRKPRCFISVIWAVYKTWSGLFFFNNNQFMIVII